VIDVGGTVVSGAHVTLVTDSATAAREAVADSEGHFIFADVAAGNFKLTISCDGLETSLVSGTLHRGEAYEVPKVVLRVATAHTSVDVTLSKHDLAEPEVKAEEKQRLIGAIPNYYVSYTWNAPPMDSRQKFDLAWKSTIDPASFVIVAGFAGIEQWQNDYSGYGRGAAGYGKRFGAGVGNMLVGNMLGGAVLPVVFHQDPRYFYKGTGSVWSRTGYALSRAVIARGDNGRWQPNYSGILGNLGAGAISNLYYPASSRQGAGLTIGNGLLGIASDGASNVLQEFVLRKLTKHAKSN
jgi:Carboxypeptidase regulatory-like domain